MSGQVDQLHGIHHEGGVGDHARVRDDTRVRHHARIRQRLVGHDHRQVGEVGIGDHTRVGYHTRVHQDQGVRECKLVRLADRIDQERTHGRINIALVEVVIELDTANLVAKQQGGVARRDGDRHLIYLQDSREEFIFVGGIARDIIAVVQVQRFHLGNDLVEAGRTEFGRLREEMHVFQTEIFQRQSG